MKGERKGGTGQGKVRCADGLQATHAIHLLRLKALMGEAGLHTTDGYTQADHKVPHQGSHPLGKRTLAELSGI